MPAPTGSEIASLAKGAVQSAGLEGENAPDLADAIGETCGQALQLFMGQAMVMPGIPAAAPPPPGSGATVYGSHRYDPAGPSSTRCNTGGISTPSAPSLAQPSTVCCR